MKNPRKIQESYEIINLGNNAPNKSRGKKTRSLEGCACKLCAHRSKTRTCRERPACWWSSRKFHGMINQCPREIWRQDLLKSRVGDPSATNRSLVTVITAFLRQYIHTASLPINLSLAFVLASSIVEHRSCVRFCPLNIRSNSLDLLALISFASRFLFLLNLFPLIYYRIAMDLLLETMIVYDVSFLYIRLFCNLKCKFQRRVFFNYRLF